MQCLKLAFTRALSTVLFIALSVAFGQSYQTNSGHFLFSLTYMGRSVS
jgi:hypothetical protein